MRCWSARVRLVAWNCVLLSAIAGGVGTADAQAGAAGSAPGERLQEVTVTAVRALDHKTLDHAVNSFVASHSAPGTRINQLGRWLLYVCPLVSGLRPAFNELVTRDVLDVARGAGAPVKPAGKPCDVNVEIVFTADPQALLDHMAESYRPLLGLFPASQRKQMTTFSRPIQAWYETATRSMDMQMPVVSMASSRTPPGVGNNAAEYRVNAGPANLGGAQLDTEETAAGMMPPGVAGSRIRRGLRSEFAHVFIIADSNQVSRYSLQSVADYIAMLSLARIAQLQNCAPLASITDLLAEGCATGVPDGLTAADRAYLKALYAANLEQSLNMERGDVHERMMRQIEGK
jgi:hypothetical protein